MTAGLVEFMLKYVDLKGTIIPLLTLLLFIASINPYTLFQSFSSYNVDPMQGPKCAGICY